MGFSGSLLDNSVMGVGLAAAIAPGCGSVGGLVVSSCQVCLWINFRPRRAQRFRIEFAESAPGDTRTHRHAAGICDLRHWTADLAKNRGEGEMEITRSSLPLCIAHDRDVNQRSNCLCLFASWDCDIRMALLQGLHLGTTADPR